MGRVLITTLLLLTALAGPGRADGTLELRGRVVTDGRIPVAGVRVAVHIRGSEPILSKTDEQGAFSLAGVPRGIRIVLHATDKASRAAVVDIPSDDSVVPMRDAGTILLRPAACHEFAAMHGGEVVEGARFEVHVGDFWTRSGPIYDSGTDGPAAILPSGTYRLIACAPGLGRTKTTLTTTMVDEETRVELPEAVALDLRLVAGEERRPVSGAEVRVLDALRDRIPSDFGIYHGPVSQLGPYDPHIPMRRTDEEGRVRLEGLSPQDDLFLDLVEPGSPPRHGILDLRVVGHTDREEVILAVAWDAGPPQIAARHLLPPGPRALEVEVRELDGRPVPGARVGVWMDSKVAPARLSGEDGVARFAHLPAGIVRVGAGPKVRVGRKTYRMQGGYSPVELDLREADGRAVLTLRPELEVMVCFEGRKGGGLPEDHCLDVGGALVWDLEERPEDSRVRLVLRPGAWREAIGLAAWRPDCDPLSFRLDPDPGGPPPVIRLPRRRAPEVRVRGGAGATMLRLLEGHPWASQVGFTSGYGNADPRKLFDSHPCPWRDGEYRDTGIVPFYPRTPGACRIHHPAARYLGPPFDVPADGLDLAVKIPSVELAHGRVVAPEGVDLGKLRLSVVADDGLPRWFPPTGGSDGTWFRFNVPAKKRVRIVAEHPDCAQVPRAGVEMLGGRTNMTLRLEKGPRATFTPAVVNPLRGFTYARVSLLEPGKGTIARTFFPRADQGEAAICGFPPGRWDLRIDLPAHRPVFLSGVRLGEGETALGGIRFEPGSRIRLSFPQRPGLLPPLVRLLATAISGPGGPDHPPWRNPFLYCHPDVDEGASGLSAGRYRVTAVGVNDLYAGRILIDREVDVDGETDVLLPVELPD